MPTENSENVPRGTWNDDNASSGEATARRSVSGPYRDERDTMRARRAALEREMREVDLLLEAQTRVERELARASGALSSASRPGRLATIARWASRAVMASMPALLVGAALLVYVLPMREPPRTVVHVGPSVLRVARDQYVVERQVVDSIATNRGGTVLLEPVVEKDAIIGLRIVTFPWMRELGLERGDVILAVDDRDIAAPDGARAAYDAIRVQDHFEIVVRRQGEVRHLRYDMIGI